MAEAAHLSGKLERVISQKISKIGNVVSKVSKGIKRIVVARCSRECEKKGKT